MDAMTPTASVNIYDPGWISLTGLAFVLVVAIVVGSIISYTWCKEKQKFEDALERESEKAHHQKLEENERELPRV